MNRNRVLVGALAMALYGQTSVAQSVDYDDRWYIAPRAGVVFADNKRDADNSLLLGVGIGRFFHPRFAIDLELMHNNADLDLATGNWENLGLGVAGRMYFSDSGNWRPYVMAGVGSLRHDRDRSDSGSDWAFQAGVGLHSNMNERVNFRAEVGYRYDADDESLLTRDDYSDYIASLGVTIALGDRASPPAAVAQDDPPPPPMPEKTCADLDDDGDGINNCDDKCPGTATGMMVGADGCAVPVGIDLRGVNFDFDKCTLRSDAIAILDAAVTVLGANPIRVEVAGHTDAVGTDAYNQRLSECRAKVVADYLTGNGVSTERIAGVNGYGESRPIDTNDTAEGRARNRRTELNVQQ